MDRVRLGRALGYGTRHAAKTVAALAEAASAPGPARKGAGAPGATPISAASASANSVPAAPVSAAVRQEQAPRVIRPSTRNLGHGVKHFKRSFWGPLATFSGALWLRVTGLFFALIALAMGEGAWRLRGALHASNAPVQIHRFWLFLAFALLFGYFTVSSFVRASLRERRAATGLR